MKILVCISKAPDTTTKIAFKDNNKFFDESNVQFIVNPYDEWYALVRALELKETLGGTVTIIHVGTADSETVIRKALAIGADDAIRIDGDAADTYYVAAQIAAHVKSAAYDLILAGKETINYNGSSMGGMLAELLDLPFISLATKLDMQGDTAIVEQDIDGGTRVVECDLPLVISAAKGMAEARIPNMRGIMAARTKPLQVIAPAAVETQTEVKEYALAQGRTTCKYIDAANPEQLLDLLHNEAKVL
jgi:electron transfer flavoprotein beta subunit